MFAGRLPSGNGRHSTSEIAGDLPRQSPDPRWPLRPHFCPRSPSARA